MHIYSLVDVIIRAQLGQYLGFSEPDFDTNESHGSLHSYDGQIFSYYSHNSLSLQNFTSFPEKGAKKNIEKNLKVE